ncbi:MAG: TolC family protein [Candidatus Latescibacteria bacterium]|nr:TolC family protein [Candidatus Latescibacterota bacterium]
MIPQLTLVAVCLYAAVAAAQGDVLTLEQAIGEARERNPEMLVAEQQVRQAELAMFHATVYSNPTLAFGAVSDDWPRLRIIDDRQTFAYKVDQVLDSLLWARSGRLPVQFPKMAADNTVSAVSASYTAADVIITKEFNLSFTRGLRKQAARAAIAKAQFDAENTARLVSIDVTRLFMEVTLLSGLHKVSEREASLQARLYEVSRVKHEAAFIPAFQLRLAAITYQNTRNELTQTLNEIAAAKMELNRALGRQPNDPLELSLINQTSEPELDLGELEQRALAQRPDVQAARAEVAAARAEAAIGRREWVPDVGLGLSYLRAPNSRLWGLEVEVPLPLFDRGQAERAVSGAALRTAELELAALKATVRGEVAATHRTFNAALERHKFYLTNGLDRPVDLELEAVERAFDEGQVGLFEAIQTQLEFLEIQRSYNESAHETRLALAELAAAVGVSFNDWTEVGNAGE